MKSARQFRIVLVTAPDLKTARMLARRALESRLIACANLVPHLESHYWWQGGLEKSAEVLLVMKTAQRHLGALEKLILGSHPYDTAEILALPVEQGTERYLRWLSDSVR